MNKSFDDHQMSLEGKYGMSGGGGRMSRGGTPYHVTYPIMHVMLQTTLRSTHTKQQRQRPIQSQWERQPKHQAAPLKFATCRSVCVSP